MIFVYNIILKGNEAVHKLRNFMYFGLVLLIGFLIVVISIITISEDRTSPEISFTDDIITVSVTDDDSILLDGVSANDVNDGNVTSSLVVEKLSDFNSDGTRTITYAASDLSNNVSKATRKVKYTDYKSPEFDLTEDTTFFSSDQNINIAKLLTASDVFDGDVSVFVKLVDDNIIIGQGGSYYATVMVYNSAGDVSTLNLPVVIEAGSLNANAPKILLNTYILYLDKNSSTPKWKDYIDVLQEQTNSSNTTDNAKEIKKVKIDDSNVDLNQEGSYYVNYEYTNSKDLVGTTRLIVVVR